MSDSNNERQTEVAAVTGNTYIPETITDSIEIPTANLWLASDCNSDRQPDIAIWPPEPEIIISLEL